LGLSGMKYTNLILRPLAVLLTLAAFCPARSQAQSAYVSGAPSATSAYDGAPVVNSAIANSDDPQSALITIRKRVDEVNVLFIATDKRGKFVRDHNIIPWCVYGRGFLASAINSSIIFEKIGHLFFTVVGLSARNNFAPSVRAW